MNNGWYQNGYGGYGNYGQEPDRMRTGYGQNPYWNGQNSGQPMPQMQQMPPQNQPLELYDVIGQGTRVDWVQGEAAMKSYMVRPGMSAILFDMDNPKRVYVKAVNMSGVPIFTAGFNLDDIELGKPAETINDDRYVPRAEYEKSMKHIAQLFANLTEREPAERNERYDERKTETARMGHESERSAEWAAEPAERDEPAAGFPGI